jgi:hypothetical protein
MGGDPALGEALARAAAAIARLDQALVDHPLLPAVLYRARLEAVGRQAVVDGQAIDPWHLAALLEGLRLRMDPMLRIIDRSMILASARHALDLHQWLTAPDFDQEGEVQRAERVLSEHARQATPLLAAAAGCQAWLGSGEGRAPLRAALVRHWTRHRLLRVPVPLTGTAAFRAEVSWELATWVPAFLTALAGEAEDGLQLLSTLEHAWLAARRAVAARRRQSRAPAAVDILAAAPLISATSLAGALGMAVKNAAALLEEFRAGGIAVEVTHRSKRRLYGLAGLAPLRDGVIAPRRPMPGRSRGRPPQVRVEEPVVPAPALTNTPLAPLERREFDTSDLEAAIAFADDAIRRARRTLETLMRGQIPPREGGPEENGADLASEGGPE